MEPVITVRGTGIMPAFASLAESGVVFCRISNKSRAPGR